MKKMKKMKIDNKIRESLDRSLMLMKYDSKKTLSENENIIEEQASSWHTGIGAGLGAAAGYAGGAALGAAATGAATGAKIGAFGGPIGLAVGIGLGAGLGWLISWATSDKVPAEKAKMLFQACITYRSKLGQPTIDKVAMNKMADQIYNATENYTWGTDEESIIKVFQQTQTLANFCGVVDSYGRMYGDLLSELDDEFDSSDWTLFYQTLRDSLEQQIEDVKKQIEDKQREEQGNTDNSGGTKKRKKITW